MMLRQKMQTFHKGLGKTCVQQMRPKKSFCRLEGKTSLGVRRHDWKNYS